MVAIQKRRRSNARSSGGLLLRVACVLVAVYLVFMMLMTPSSSPLDELEASKALSSLSSHSKARQEIVQRVANMKTHAEDPKPIATKPTAAKPTVHADSGDNLRSGQQGSSGDEPAADINELSSPDLTREVGASGDDDGVAKDSKDQADATDEADEDDEDAESQIVLQDGSNTQGEPEPGSANHQIAISREGSGPTSVAYLKDFDHERRHPEFRDQFDGVSSEFMSEAAGQVGASSLTSCRTVQDRNLLQDPHCEDSPIVAYNPANFARTWCEHHIAPKEAIQLPDACAETTVRVLDVDVPPLDGVNMPPVVIKSTEEAVVPSDLEDVECDVPCKHERGMGGNLRYIDGQPWEIVQTMADSYRSREAKLELTAFRRNKFYSTQSWLSSVPMSHYSFEKFSLRDTTAVEWDMTQNEAIYFASTDCSAQTRRNKYVAALTRIFPVSAVGTCNHNAEVPFGEEIDTAQGRIQLMQKYRFVLAFDYISESDHISESVWESFVSGALPVVVGAGNIRDHLPPKSYIDAGDFKDWDMLAHRVKMVSEDQALWESYHTWRTDETLLAEFENKYAFTRTDPECRLCRWAYAKQYGLGWNHAQQIVTEPSLSRRLCSSDTNGLVSEPFDEQWFMINNDKGVRSAIMKPGKDDEMNCMEASVKGSITTPTFQVERTITHHDGVLDFKISSTSVLDAEYESGDLVLRLRFSTMHNPDGAYFSNIHTMLDNQPNYGALMTSGMIQDERSKVTVMTNWETSIVSQKEGTIQVVLRSGKDADNAHVEEFTIRVITEDRNVLHDKMTEATISSFAKLMMMDFVGPLETYYVAEAE